MNTAKGTSKRPIIVLGVERSGTSVVAEMVHRWGDCFAFCGKYLSGQGSGVEIG